jgi:type II secretory pathway pseudopilin PulG
VALLEVLAALTIFATAAVSVVGLLAQSTEHERRAESAEQRLADEERLLAAVALLTRDDLDRRLGRRAAGPYVVEIQRPVRTLYRVTVALGDAPDAPDLATLVYRPEPIQ